MHALAYVSLLAAAATPAATSLWTLTCGTRKFFAPIDELAKHLAQLESDVSKCSIERAADAESQT